MEKLERLKNRDYYLLIDKSGSMCETDTANGQTRFQYAEESTIALSKAVSAYDPDGITVIPFAGSFKVYDNVTEAKVKDVFLENSPMGGTVLAPPLKKVFDTHNAKKKSSSLPTNGSICVVITDGQPKDEDEVASTIINFTKTLENGDDEFGLLFLQVGKDSHAKKYLEKLDDNLTGAKFDIVDAKTMDDMENLGVIDAIVGSLDD